MARKRCVVGDDGWITVFFPEGLLHPRLSGSGRQDIVDMPTTGRYAGATFAYPRKLVSRVAPGICTLRVPSDWEFRLRRGQRGEPEVCIGFDEWFEAMGEHLLEIPA